MVVISGEAMAYREYSYDILSCIPMQNYRYLDASLFLYRFGFTRITFTLPNFCTLGMSIV